MKSVNDLILSLMGTDDSHVTYQEVEPMTTKDKVVNCSRAREDLKHDPSVPLNVGIRKTIESITSVYDPNTLAEAGLEDTHDSVGSVAVPERWPAGFESVSRRNPAHDLKDPILVETGDDVGSLCDGDRSLSLSSQGNAGNSEHGGLLLGRPRSL